MIHIKSALQRVPTLGAAATLLLAAVIPAVSLTRSASAAALTNRSLMVTSTVANDDVAKPDGGTYTGLAPGDPRNGGQVGHTYTFTPGTTDDVQVITIEYCETAFAWVGSGACAATDLLSGGTGFSAAAWNGASVMVNGVSMTITATANKMTLTNASGVSLDSNNPVTITFTPNASNYFVNPNAAYKTVSNGTYFAQIQTYDTVANATAAATSSSDNPAGMIDNGTVTNNVTTAIGIYTRVQETLNFSVEGDTGSQFNGTPTGPTAPNWNLGVCDPLKEPGLLKMGDTNSALEPNTSNKVTSYFRLSTNASNGTNVYYSGNTLANSGETYTFDTNAPIATGTPYASGVEAFGLGINVTGSSLTNLVADTGYDNAENNSYSFDTGSSSAAEVIALANGVVACDTGRVDYMASIAPETPAGIYQTKINYIASPRY